MRGSELIVELLAQRGITTYFTVTGGAIVPLLDAAHRHPACKIMAFQHEAGAALAAEGLYRQTGAIACVACTSGPGAQNILNGYCGCYYDSTPGLFITGAVNTTESLEMLKCRPRQRGFQEMPVVHVFERFSKYCGRPTWHGASVATGHHLRATVDAAVNAMTDGRLGPSLIDLPVNLQMVDVGDATQLLGSLEGGSELGPFNTTAALPSPLSLVAGALPSGGAATDLAASASQTLAQLRTAERPLLVVGNGVRLSGARAALDALLRALQLPWSTDEARNMGSHGVYGSRAANFATQNADLLLVLGCRLDSRQAGGNLKLYAPAAIKLIVDIDADEVEKLTESGMSLATPIITDVAAFLPELSGAVGSADQAAAERSERVAWLGTLSRWKAKYSSYTAEVDAPKRDPHGGVVEAGRLNAYAFLEEMDRHLPEVVTVVADVGAAAMPWLYQTLHVRGQQLRAFGNNNNASMGSSLPMCIGAAATGEVEGERMILSVTGDGGMMMNIQECKTLVDYRLPIKVVVINNSGYGMIKHFQQQYFGGRTVATAFPPSDFAAIARGFGMHAITIDAATASSPGGIGGAIDAVLAMKGPALIDVLVQTEQLTMPKLEFGNSLMHMAPYLDEAELKREMLVEVPPCNKGGGWTLTTPEDANAQVKEGAGKEGAGKEGAGKEGAGKEGAGKEGAGKEGMTDEEGSRPAKARRLVA